MTLALARSCFTFLHNPASPNGDPGAGTPHSRLLASLFSHVIYQDLLSEATPSQLLQVLGPRGDSGSKQHGQTFLSMASLLGEVTGGVALADIDRNDHRRYVEAGRLVAKTAGLAPGASGFLINGRVRFRPLLCPFPPLDHVYRSLGRSDEESSEQRITGLRTGEARSPCVERS
jgi:hypothetical protein